MLNESVADVFKTTSSVLLSLRRIKYSNNRSQNCRNIVALKRHCPGTAVFFKAETRRSNQSHLCYSPSQSLLFCLFILSRFRKHSDKIAEHILAKFDPDKTGSVRFEELLLAFCLCMAGSGKTCRTLNLDKTCRMLNMGMACRIMNLDKTFRKLNLDKTFRKLNLDKTCRILNLDYNFWLPNLNKTCGGY